MNTEQQAKSGFKTFATTLVISLVVFSVAYHFLTGLSGSIPDAETFQGKKEEVTALADAVEPSVFGVISNKPTTSQPTVLAAGDAAETTESTVPATGSDTLIGMGMGMVLVSVAAYLMFIGPRKLALRSFENDITK